MSSVNVIEVPSGRLGYRQVLDAVLTRGSTRSPRGLKTVDLGPTTVVLHTAYDALPVGVGRNLNRAVAAAEAIQLIGAFTDPELLTRASPNFERYREPDGSFYGAYGERIGFQLLDVVEKLKKDPDTRQAVITLWEPRRDNMPGKKDYPCTVALGFAIVRDRLELYTQMRSNDVWLGVPYDWFQFTQLQLTVANILGMPAGPYRHSAWSLHIYEEHIERAVELVDDPARHEGISDTYEPTGFGDRSVQVLDLLTRLRTLPYEGVENMTKSERWYREQLRDKS